MAGSFFFNLDIVGGESESLSRRASNADQAWCLPSVWSAWGNEGGDIDVPGVEMFGDGVEMES